MGELCRHGKRLANDDDLSAYANRPACVEAGDCDCHLCRAVCWSGVCARRAEYLASANRRKELADA